MFKDFHESTRNVGMMSMILGLLVLAGFWGLGMAVYSGLGQDDQGGPSLSSQIELVEASLAVNRDDLMIQQTRLEELEGFQEKLTMIREQGEALRSVKVNLTELQQTGVSIKASMLEIESSFEAYRQRYRENERGLAKGEVIDLSESKGPDFKECKILGISPLHLRVMRSAGPMGIPYQELPKSVQDRFQFDEDEAEAYAKFLAAGEARKDQEIAAFRKKQSEKRAMEAKAQKAQRAKNLVLLIQQNENLATKLDEDAKTWEGKAQEMERKAAAAKRNGQITSNPGHARQARNKSKRLMEQARGVRATARKLQAELDQIEAQREK